MRLDGFRQRDQVLRQYTNDTEARTINIGDEEERDRYDDRQDHKVKSAVSALAVSKEHIAGDGDE